MVFFIIKFLFVYILIGNFNSEKEKIKEIIDCINFNFKDKETAFNYFLQNTTNNIINLNLFITGIYNLLPRRFTKRELTNIFKKITSNKNFIDNEEFTKIFNFVSKKNLLIENEKIELNQIKQKFETNETDLKKEFIKFDKKKNGLINVIEFKNVLKALKIGIKTKEIDELIRKNADEKGFINYEQFLLRIKSNNFKNKMNERVKEKIEKMIDNIKDYFISERDVFRRFNTKGDGELKLEEFTKLITILNKKNNEKIYSYDVIKDLFDFCDLRNDGVIDIHEWSLIFQVFIIKN